MDIYKKSVVDALHSALSKEIDASLIEVPPNPSMGDFAFPCFSLAKELRKSPAAIASELATQIKPNKIIAQVKAIGPYLNFFVNKESLAKSTLKKVFAQKENYGKGTKKNYTVMIESPGPNTNKPLHLGHVRNMVLGNALINMFDFTGNKTVRVDIVNDRGIHICKSMLAYQKFGHNKNPDKKSDHFVGDFYVRYAKELENHPEFEEEIKVMLKNWEDGEPKTRTLLKKMNDWAVSGFKETYERYGVKMDKAYHESDHYMKGKELALEGLKKGIFEKDDKGNIIVDLEKEGLGKKVVLRADGTSIYITQDLVLAKLRLLDYSMNKLIYVVGNEQIHHFQSLFKIFELFEFPFAKDCFHLAYGMINLPEGKMKSRVGKVVDADDLADEMHSIAKEEIKKRFPDLSENELVARAEQIGLSAIKFFILKYDPMKDFTYDPKESISFEGETGPYVQYTHARICSIIRKYGKAVSDDVDYSLLIEKEEHELIKMLTDYSAVMEKSALEYKPSIICRYLLDLSQNFNNYYHAHKVIQENVELEKARILLVYSVKEVLKSGLAVLGIDSPDEM
ncbi:MAG: arginine--tRNA ligase [archaeon]